ncbi:MAG TPA: hypothetical protein V6C84_10480 [Coleofasciculaceae cyanobacterium]
MSGIFKGLAGVVGGLFGVLGSIFSAIGGLFRSKSQSQEVQSESPQQNGAYFLTADDAITLGNVEYMRSSTSTRRTFPKAKLGKDNAYVQSVSSLKKADLKAQAIAEEKLPTLSEQPKTERRRADSSLDMFRNMARDMKKD